MQIINARYELIEKLGHGGMGAVFRAKDRLSQKEVALKKVLAPEANLQMSFMTESKSNFRLSLAQEFRILATMRHPNIISVLDYGFDADRAPYFTMELLPNAQTITQYAQNLDEKARVKLLIELLQALEYLHRHRITHRDLKPDNVLVAEGRVRVLDFGLSTNDGSQAFEDDQIAGTLGYIAPEILRSEFPPSERSDLYSVGIIAYQIFAGQLPFNPLDLSGMISTLPDMDLVPASVGVSLAIAKLLNKDPFDRFMNAHETIIAFCEAIGEAVPQEAEDVRESFLQNAPFIGRQQEISVLHAALMNLVELDKGSAWLVAGENGVGKSRLLEEFRVQALVQNVLVLYGRVEQHTPTSNNLWQNPLRRLCLQVEIFPHEASVLQEIIPDLQHFLNYDITSTSSLDAEAYQKRLMVNVAQVFERCSQPILLLLEDLHWIEDDLDFVRRIVRLHQEMPLMVIATYRSDESPYLYGQLSKMQVLELQRFNPQELEELSVAMLGDEGRKPELIELLAEQTEGNVFFAIEIVRVLAKDLSRLSEITAKKQFPEDIFTKGIANFALRRLNQLPLDYQPMLRLAAVLGKDIDFALLESIDDEMDYPDWLLTCYDASLLDVDGERWHFAHDKLREGILQSLDPKQRPRLNELAAEAIESVYGDNPTYAARLADHWRMAGNMTKTLHYTLIVAKQLNQTGLFRRTLRLLQRALRLFRSQPEPKANAYIAEILITIGECYTALGEVHHAFDAHEEAYAFATQAQQKPMQAAALLGMADGLCAQSEHLTAETHILEALEIWRELNHEVGLARSLYLLAYVLLLQGSFASAKEYILEALELWQRLGAEWQIAQTLNQLSRIEIHLGNYAAAEKILLQALALHEQQHNSKGLAEAYSLWGRMYHNQGNFQAAQDALNRALDLADEIGWRLQTGVSMQQLGMLNLDMKNLRVAQSYLDNSLAILRDINYRDGIAQTLAYKARLCFQSEDLETAHDVLYEATALAVEITSILMKLIVLHSLALLWHALGKSEAALEWLALVQDHSELTYYERTKLERSMQQMERGLGADVAAQARARGKTLELNTVLTEILIALTP